jgi:hypothetical protein
MFKKEIINAVCISVALYICPLAGKMAATALSVRATELQ